MNWCVALRLGGAILLMFLGIYSTHAVTACIGDVRPKPQNAPHLAGW